MPKEFAVISVPSLVFNVADGQIEAVFSTAEQALSYIDAEKPMHPDRRYGIREKPQHENNSSHISDT
jgi:hypothetical protein